MGRSLSELRPSPLSGRPLDPPLIGPLTGMGARRPHCLVFSFPPNTWVIPRNQPQPQFVGKRTGKYPSLGAFQAWAYL